MSKILGKTVKTVGLYTSIPVLGKGCQRCKLVGQVWVSVDPFTVHTTGKKSLLNVSLTSKR